MSYCLFVPYCVPLQMQILVSGWATTAMRKPNASHWSMIGILETETNLVVQHKKAISD